MRQSTAADLYAQPASKITKSSNGKLHAARSTKKDEFYTQLSDIEKELGHYKGHFKGKVVFCNCDDPEESNFWKYFERNFNHLGLKRLVSTHFVSDGPSYKLEIQNRAGMPRITKTPLRENGDFRSEECVQILEESDIVVTNPPFSLFREYIAQLIKHDKSFLILGSMNATTYKETFQLVMDNKIWLGRSIHGGERDFRVPDHYPGAKTDKDGNKFISVGVRWFTNLDYHERHQDLILFRKYRGNEAEYPRYDGSKIINVDKTSQIPDDFDGIMGVPITFIDKYSPDQFRILGIANSARSIGLRCLTVIDGRKLYNRVLIQRIR